MAKGDKTSSERWLDDESDEDIYDEISREILLDNDELSPFEEAFMRGYEEAI